MNRLRTWIDAAKVRAINDLYRCLSWDTSADRVAYDLGRQRTFHHFSFMHWRSIEYLRRNGFAPTGILDVGAYDGDWTRLAISVFPSTPVFMIEANPAKQTGLAEVCGHFGERVSYAIGLVGAESRLRVPFYLMESGGSSVLPEKTTFSRSVSVLPMVTLDSLTGAWLDRGPLLLKLDVQGYELEVLRGAHRVLSLTEVIDVEVSLIEYNYGSPLFADIVSYLAQMGFVAYDICEFARRESDQALYQVDMVFVRATSAMRSHKQFWSREP